MNKVTMMEKLNVISFLEDKMENKYNSLKISQSNVHLFQKSIIFIAFNGL